MSEKSLKNLFENLGRATLRGVRKCPKCGTFNGTRSISCKNTECNLIFKHPKEKPKVDFEIEAVKIVCNSGLQVFSVTVNEYQRCFVHLPVIEGIEALQDDAEITVIKQSAAMCYDINCRKPVVDMCTINLNLNPCSHTQAVMNCLLEAHPLIIKKTVIKTMPISELMREQIHSLASNSEEHLVQRISKNALVVRCNPYDKHPLGFLHFSVFEPVKPIKKFRILCECLSENKPYIPREKQMCLHFFMCICAFASDLKLLDEFKSLVQCVLTVKTPANGKNVGKDADLQSLKAFFNDDVKVSSKRKHIEILDACDVVLEENEIYKSDKCTKKISVPSKTKPSVVLPSICFEEWLASVTERINETMHYQFPGSPEPLVFQVPQLFFDLLQQKISSGSKKKRLPNMVTAFSKKDAAPVGVFSKYTWRITNLLHVKRIFDTMQVPLEITRNFMEIKDGTYVPYNPIPEETKQLIEKFRKTLNTPYIKPLELKTFLKVGHMALNEKEVIPFIIEWIPDILPKTHVGELKLTFKYGHQKNGKIQNEITNINKQIT